MRETVAKPKLHPIVRIIIVLGVIIAAVVIFAVCYYYSKLDYITYTPADSFEVTDVLSEEILKEEIELASGSDVEVVSNMDAVQSVEVVEKEENITNILLIGTDSEGWGNTRSDCMIICSVNKDTHEIRLVSFMRDLYVKIPDYNGKSFKDQKMTHAFAYGGAKLLMNTIEENFGVEIDNYVRVNFKVMPKLINTLGGFSINLSASEAEFMNAWAKTGGYDPVLEEGYNWINGEMALIYARCRDDGDYNRTKRQQKVLTLCAERLKGVSVSRFDKFVNAFCKNVQTDMTQSEITAFVLDAAKYFEKLDSMQMITIPGKKDKAKGKIINGYYVLVDNRELSLRNIQSFLYEGAVFESESTYTGNSFKVKRTTKGTTTTTAVSDSDTTSTTISQSDIVTAVSQTSTTVTASETTTTTASETASTEETSETAAATQTTAETATTSATEETTAATAETSASETTTAASASETTTETSVSEQ